MFIVLGLLNVVTIFHECIFSMLLSDCRARGLRSIPIAPIAAFTEFLHVDEDINVQPLLVSWYFISCSLLWYLCSCMYTMSMLCFTADAVNYGNWPIRFKVLSLNVAIGIVLLLLRNLCLCLSSVAEFFEHWSQSSNLSRTRLFLSCAKSEVVLTYGLSEGHGNLLMAFFYLINRRYPKW